MTIVDREEFAPGIVIKIAFDDDPTSPRENDNLGIMLCWHPRYTLGDEQFRDPDEVGGARSMREVAKYIQRERGGINLIPLYLYDHSGISISAGATIEDKVPEITAQGVNPWDSAGWDTSAVGFIFTTKEQIELMGSPDDRLDEILRGEVTEYNDFLTGQVFGYVVERHTDPDCEIEDCPHHVVKVESCWGYIGDSKYAMEEARASAKYLAEHP